MLLINVAKVEVKELLELSSANNVNRACLCVGMSLWLTWVLHFTYVPMPILTQPLTL